MTETKLDSSRVTQIFNTTVYGGAANLVGAATDSTIEFNIAAKDFDSLDSVLRESGVSDRDILELKSALDTDDPPESAERFGPKVSAWIAKMMQKAAEGSWGIGVGAAGSLLAQVIAKFYGL